MNRSLLQYAVRVCGVALAFVAMSSLVQPGGETTNNILSSLTIADVSAGGGGGGSECNNCRDFMVTIGCPGGGCHTPYHDFGPLPGCWDGQDCKECNQEHGGCHGGDQEGRCEDEHPTGCEANFAVWTEEVRDAVARGEIATLKQLLASGTAYVSGRQSLVLRSSCDARLVTYVPVSFELGNQIAKHIKLQRV